MSKNTQKKPFDFFRKKTYSAALLKIFGAALLLFLCSRNPDKEILIDAEKPKYGFTTSSLSFFRNVRSLYYDAEENETAKLLFYRNSDRPKPDKFEKIIPVIVLSEENREAYIFLEIITSDKNLPESIGISVENSSGKKEEFLVKKENRDGYFRTSAKIYNGILNNDKILINNDKATRPLFADADEKEIFRKTLLDYYRLTQVIRWKFF